MTMDEPMANPTSTGHPALVGRARWLIVGDRQWAQQVRRAITPWVGQGTIGRVPGFLAALGALAVEPADVVIGPLEAIEGMVEPTARSLREVAPQARLLLVAGAGQREVAATAIGCGFDACVERPVDADRIAVALGLDHGADGFAGQSGAPAGEGAGHDAVLFGNRHEPQETGDGKPQLGDVDLVEAILSGRGGLRKMALRIVTSRSGIADLRWAEAENGLPIERTAAPITFGDHSFGVLHCPNRPPPARLAAWAAWLGRWLALDQQVNELKDTSMRDELTGLWNRRYFNRFLLRILEWAADDRSQVTLLLFDIDDFKLYNDRYGHVAGDDILCEASRLMKSVVREHDVVARISGDEFAVIFWDAEGRRQPDSQHPQDVLIGAKRFQQAICTHRFPKLLDEAPGTLTISGGLACFPWDGRTPDELIAKADEMALRSKRQGKNAITFGPGALRLCRSIG